jgi:predicted transcriptional regulator
MSDVNARVITAHVPIPLAEQVDELAVRLDHSRGWIVRHDLAAWIEQEESRNRAETSKPRRASGREKR